MRLLTRSPEVTALFAVNDPAAIGAMKAAWDLGRRTPEDLAIVGAGDIAHGDMLRVPLTTVSWSREDLGREAARLILDQIEAHPDGPFKRVVVPPALRIRASCGASMRAESRGHPCPFGHATAELITPPVAIPRRTPVNASRPASVNTPTSGFGLQASDGFGHVHRACALRAGAVEIPHAIDHATVAAGAGGDDPGHSRRDQSVSGGAALLARVARAARHRRGAAGHARRANGARRRTSRGRWRCPASARAARSSGATW